MTTPKAKFAGLALIAAMCAGFTLGLTACTDERARTGAETPPAEAVKWYHKVAEQSVAEAQTEKSLLGVVYRKAKGGPHDDAEAVKWYRKAAEQGDGDAQFNLALMYYNGLYVPQDYAEAAKWYRKAAEQGHAKAQYNLDLMYGKGLGVSQDEAQAHMWFNLAASRYPPGEDRDRVVKNRDIIAKMMTQAQISEAQKLAREWRPKK